jgi:hypothetical protein
MDLTREAFAEWKAHPVTIEIFKEIGRMKRSIEETLGDGQTLGASADETLKITAMRVGQIDGLNQLTNIYFEEAEE